MPNFKKTLKEERGIALFIAIIAISAILIIVLSIADISYKEQVLTYSGKDSKIAFYAADSGLECALYHDIKKGNFFFANPPPPAPSQVGVIECDEATNITPSITSGLETITIFNPPPPTTYDNVPFAQTTFSYNLSGSSDSCVIVTVRKTKLLPTNNIRTKIEARGYNNTCNTTTNTVNVNIRNLERALEVSY